MAQIISISFPLQLGTIQQNFPIGVEFLGAWDDGVNLTLSYYQFDETETVEKQRTIEIQPAIAIINNDGRTFIAHLSNNWLVFENTENTIPDSQAS